MTRYLDSIDQLDLARYVRAGDTVIWGQACAEPVTLTERLMAQRGDIGRLRCFLGIPATDTVRPEHADHVSFVSYCGAGGNRSLWRAGVLDVLPSPYSMLPVLFATGRFRIDVVLLLLPPPDEHGRFSLGLADEYLSAAIDSGRLVIAEVSDKVPHTTGPRTLDASDVDVAIRTDRAPAELKRSPGGPVDKRIGEHVAGLVEDGATLQFGIGALPETILGALREHRNLGVHSGLVNDTVADLMEAGVITNSVKTVDRFTSVAGVVMGTERIFSFVDRNPAIQLRPTSYTHDPKVLAAQPKLVAINAALEVDLTGAVNAELAAGTYVGAVGGAVDFARGARLSRGGLSVVALPSATATASRIVSRLSGPVSTPRSEVDVVVTEHGVADLRGRTLGQRREAMLAVAHPDHRAQLEADLEEPAR